MVDSGAGSAPVQDRVGTEPCTRAVSSRRRGDFSAGREPARARRDLSNHASAAILAIGACGCRGASHASRRNRRGAGCGRSPSRVRAPQWHRGIAGQPHPGRLSAVPCPGEYVPLVDVVPCDVVDKYGRKPEVRGWRVPRVPAVDGGRERGRARRSAARHQRRHAARPGDALRGRHCGAGSRLDMRCAPGARPCAPTRTRPFANALAPDVQWQPATRHELGRRAVDAAGAPLGRPWGAIV